MVSIVSKKEIAKDVYDFVLNAPEIAEKAVSGQFVNIYLKNESKLLPRPISICGVNRKAGTVRIVFRIAGAGTAELAGYEEGTELKVLGPLGNGFFETDAETCILLGGGIGIPPMLGLAEKLRSDGKKVLSVLGYRNSETFLADEFEKYGDVIVATDDGSTGFHGNAVEALSDRLENENAGLPGICLFACGPLPMLRGVKKLSEKLEVPAQLSMEERMACGIGACLACVCKSTEKDEHSNVKNKRVCKDGPVFFADGIDLDR